ncbi:hypothetical protein DS67_05460 [Mesotoga sp. SC_4PWA21]|nr:hypothetical protein DS67_05460 [Mesotoga sp. SC_4PWA21]
MFQFLIGSLEAEDFVQAFANSLMFQFLIEVVWKPAKQLRTKQLRTAFQFLIGSLEAIVVVVIKASLPGFNSS